jgi:hypothetical protein
LLLKNFPLGLEKEKIAGIVAFQHLEEQSRARLKLPLAALLTAGELLEDQSGDAGDFAELAAGEFGGVETGDEVFQEVA